MYILFSFLSHDTRSLMTAVYNLRVTTDYELCTIKYYNWDVTLVAVTC